MKTHKRGLLVNSSNVALRTGAAIATLWIGALSNEAVAQNTILEGVHVDGAVPTICSTSDSNIIVSSTFDSTVGCQTRESVVIGNGAKIGDDVQAAIAIGRLTEANEDGSIAIGDLAEVEVGARAAIAMGISAKASGNNAVAIGNSADAGSGSIAIGILTESNVDSVAIGRSTKSTGTGSVAIGSGSDDGGQNGVFAIGSTGNRRKIINMANGIVANNSTDGVTGDQLFDTNAAIAAGLGGGASINNVTGAFVAPSYSVAGGTFNSVSAALTALDTQQVDAIIYDNVGRTSATLGGAGATVPVSLRNLSVAALASNSTEAVNGSQLFATNQRVAINTTSIVATAASLGAGANVNATTGAFTAPAFTVVGGTFNNVGTALDAIDAELANALIYDNPGHTSATLGGAGATVPVALRNVSAAALSAGSTDAVNGSQLFATNQRVATNTNHIAATVAGLGGGAAINSTTGAFTAPIFTAVGGSFNNVGEALAALDDELSGAVFYDDASRTRATLGAVGGSVPVSLENVGAGVLNATSTDAVNGSQLFTTNENVASLGVRVGDTETDLSTLNNGITTATIGIVQQVGGAPAAGEIRIGAATGGTSLSLLGTDGERTVSGMRAGLLSAGSTEGVNGSQLFATNQLVNANTVSISNLQTSLGGNTTAVSNLTTAVQNGTIGIVQQDPVSLQIGVGTNVGGMSVNFAGTDGNRLLSGLTAANLGATSSDAVNGSQLFATNQLVAANTTAIGLVEARVTNIEGSLGTNVTNVANLTTAIQNGTIGIVKQDPATQNITVGANTGGALITLSGTGGDRVMTGLGAGAVNAASTDAINGSQLHATNQVASNALQTATNANGGIAAVTAALGGGASYNASTGTLTAPTFNVSGSSFNDVGSALLALDDNISSVTIAASNSVQYDDASRTAVTLGSVGSAAPVALKNVQAGALTGTSSDAVNGSQLHATNQAVASNTNAITSISGRVTVIEGSLITSNQAVSNLTTAIQNGSIGIVQQDPSTLDVNVASDTGGSVVNIASNTGTRTLNGVRAGVVTASSTEAVNGSQFHALQQSLDSGLSRVDDRLNGLDSRIGTVEFDLRALRGEMNSAVASAIAIGMLPTSTNPGRFSLGMGTGVRSGQMATALGISYRTIDDMFTVQARAAFDKEAVSVGVGMGLEF